MPVVSIPPDARYISELKDMQVGATFTTIAIVRNCNVVNSPKVGEMLRIELCDRTSSFGTVIFKDHALFPLFRDKVPDLAYLVRGTIDFYQRTFSPKLSTLDPIPPDLTDALIDRLVPISKRPLQGMLAEWKVTVDSLTTPGAKAAINAIISDAGAGFFTSPAGISVHHAYRHGLLEHTLSMAQLADRVIAHYSDMPIKRDVAITAILLHDAFKAAEYTQGLRTDITAAGLLQDHVTQVYHAWMHRAREAGVAPDFALEVGHCLLAHHGELEFGAPVTPHTPTAWLVHHVDLIDAKMGAIAGVLAKEGGQELTSRTPAIDRLVLKVPATWPNATAVPTYAAA